MEQRKGRAFGGKMLVPLCETRGKRIEGREVRVRGRETAPTFIIGILFTVLTISTFNGFNERNGVTMKNFSIEKVQYLVRQAIEEAPNGSFQEMAEKVYSAIYMEGRYLTEEERLAIKKQYQHYLDYIMFKEDVEFVCIDSNSNRYQDSTSVPNKTFYRQGFRWKKTNIFLYEWNWFMYDGNTCTTCPADEFRPGFFMN